MDYLTTHTSLSPIQHGFTLGFVNYKKGWTRLASDKVYQLLAHGWWFFPGSLASSTTKTGHHDIAEILLKVALNTKDQIKSIRILTIRYKTFYHICIRYMLYFILGMWENTLKVFVNKYKIPMRNTSNWHFIHFFILQGTVPWTIILQANNIIHKRHRAIVLYLDSDSGWRMKHLKECCDKIFLFNGSDAFLTRTYSMVVHR